MARSGIVRAAGLLGVLTAVSQLLGFVRDAVVAAVYGAGAALDAYLVSQGLMNLVLALIASAMARAVVPTVSRAVAAGELEGAHRLVRSVLTLTALVLLTGGATAWLAADGLVTLLAPGFDDATHDLAVELSRIVLLAAVFIAGTDILAAAAQSHGRFFASGVQGVPFNVVMILAAGLLGQRYGIQALAWGFVVGSAVRMLLQLPTARRTGLRVRPRWQVSDPDVAEVLRLVPALLLTAAAVNVGTLVDRAVGSAQGEGVITALSLGWRVVTLVDSLLVVTLLAALYPALGAAAARGGSEVGRLVTQAMRVVLVVLVPVVLTLVLVAEPVVRLLFGRGDFDDADVSATALAVLGYAVAAIALALRSLGTRACLAMGDTRTPVTVSLVVLGVNVVGDLTLGLAYGVLGIAAATSLSLVVGAALVLRALHRRHRAVTAAAVGATALRTTLTGGLAVVVCLLLGLPGVAESATGATALVGSLALTGLVLAATYVAALRSVGSPELAETWAALGALRPGGRRRGR